MSAPEMPPPFALFRMISGFYLSRAIHVMARLGIADLLSDGPVHADELARRTKTHAPALKRVLRLLVTAGLRAPFFKRDLNNYCYQQNTFNAYCTTQVGTPVPGTNDGTGKPLVTFPLAPLNSNATFQYGQPRAFKRKYDDVLPNLGVSYDVTDALTVYASYAETLSAPRTDDLYDQILVDPGPEHSKAYDLGLERIKSGAALP